MSDADKFLIYRLRQIVAGGPLAYDAIATDEAADRIAALTAELEALRRDAERYRWLRDQREDRPIARPRGRTECPDNIATCSTWHTTALVGEELDAAIDAAITQTVALVPVPVKEGK